VNDDRLLPVAWARGQELRDDLELLHQRARAVHRASQEIRAESYEIIARCLEGRLRRERGSGTAGGADALNR
jgi:hypothetical protein